MLLFTYLVITSYIFGIFSSFFFGTKVLKAIQLETAKYTQSCVGHMTVKSSSNYS